MKPSKKKPKIKMTKPPKLVSSPPTEPDMHQSSTLMSTSQSRSSDLAWLSDAFSSLSVDQIELAYDEAGCDTFKAAGILGTHLEVEQEEEYWRNTGPTAKDYTSSHSESNDKIQTDVEEAEGFLCSMLGENSDLGMGVVRDILGMCRDDIIKFRDRASSSSMNFPMDPESVLFFERPERDTRPMEPTYSKPEIEQNIMVPEIHTYASGKMDWRKIAKKFQNGQDFKVHNLKDMSATKQEPKHGDDYHEFTKVVQHNSALHPMAVSATRQKPKCGKGDGYHEFRKVAQHNWDLMKLYYHRAAFEFSRGNRSHASCLSEKGKYYGDLARAEDERASLEIFGVRNEAYKNTATIDLHEQHVKEGIRILKKQLRLFTHKPSVKYLRVITGFGGSSVDKAKLKKSVKSLATREKIDWFEENLGTIVLKIKRRKEYTFTESHSCKK